MKLPFDYLVGNEVATEILELQYLPHTITRGFSYCHRPAPVRYFALATGIHSARPLRRDRYGPSDEPYAAGVGRHRRPTENMPFRYVDSRLVATCCSDA